LAVSSFLALAPLLVSAAGAQGPGNSLATSGDIESGGKLVSTTTSGPPLQVASTDQVVGLNADLLDGLHAASFALAADLSALQDLVAAQQDTIDSQEQLIARLHPKLVLHSSRFRAWVTFVDGGVRQPAEAVPVGTMDDSGFFYFSRDFYVDVYLTILDGRPVNARWWVFTAPLTDLEYSVTVLDTETGAVNTYSSPAGARATIFDFNAFVDTGGFPLRAPRAREESVLRLATPTTGPCMPDTLTLCLIDNRFEVTATFDTTNDPPADAQVSTHIQTSHSGAFFAFDEDVKEWVVKIVEKPTFFEVNIGTLTDVAFEVTVTDTCSGLFAGYANPQGSTTNFVDAITFPNTSCSD
jgi:hypothetical protein